MESNPNPPADLSEGMALQIIARAPYSLLLTDVRQPDNPIVYANAAFERTTGYATSAVLGRNCRFLQGPETDPRAVLRLREAVEAGGEAMVDILNYRADGAAFWNRLMIAPLTDAAGRVQYYVGVQKSLGAGRPGDGAPSGQALREVQHRVKNHLAMVVSLIRMQARRDATDLETLARRVESLQLLYEELTYGAGENGDAVALGAYLHRIAGAIMRLDDRPGLRIGFETDSVTAPMEAAVRLGLILSEVLTNALRHAFVGRDQGVLTASVRELSDGGLELRVADDGVGLPEGGTWPKGGGLGGRIVTQLVDSLGGTLSVDSGPMGATVTLRLPPTARGGY